MKMEYLNHYFMQNWISQINQTTSDFRQHFGGLNGSQLNWKPDAQTWSIAQNIDHLIVINNTYKPTIEAIKNGTHKVPFIGKLGFMTSFFGKMILNAAQPDRRRKMSTFPMWEPSSSDISDDILAQFTRHQEELKGMVNSMKDYIPKGIVISSPANPNIVYKLEKAFDIIVAHERRHLEQAKEVLSLINYSSK